MSTRCKPGDMVIVEAESGLDPCAAEHRGLTFVVRESCRSWLGVAWRAPTVFICPRCSGRRDGFYDADLRPLHGVDRSDAQITASPATRIEEPAHG